MSVYFAVQAKLLILLIVSSSEFFFFVSINGDCIGKLSITFGMRVCGYNFTLKER